MAHSFLWVKSASKELMFSKRAMISELIARKDVGMTSRHIALTCVHCVASFYSWMPFGRNHDSA